MVAQMKAKAWEVHLKPFEGSEPVEAYLSRYVHQASP
jgi:hypothetical protein